MSTMEDRAIRGRRLVSQMIGLFSIEGRATRRMTLIGIVWGFDGVELSGFENVDLMIGLGSMDFTSECVQ